ncbi:MAG: radical SAM protein [Myxococcota bacterium]
MFLKQFVDYQVRPGLKHVIIHVTNHCNFRCRHCFIDFSPKRDLPLEKYQELGRQMGPLFWLDLAGGEPFLRKDLAEICASFDAEVVTIPTNAYLTDKVVEMTQRIRAAIQGELTISISVDGLKDTHNRIRGEAESWDRLWATFEALQRLPGIRVKINTVLCKENQHEILELMEDVLRRGPDFHSIILLRGSPIDPTFGLPDLKTLRRLEGPIFEILAQYDYGQSRLVSHVLRNYHRYLWSTSLRTLEQRTQVIPCLAGTAHAVVMGNGDVSSCEMLAPVGNVKEQAWQELWHGDAMDAQRKSIANKECHCTHNCAMLDSILFRPASYPHLVLGVPDVG